MNYAALLSSSGLSTQLISQLVCAHEKVARVTDSAGAFCIDNQTSSRAVGARSGRSSPYSAHLAHVKREDTDTRRKQSNLDAVFETSVRHPARVLPLTSPSPCKPASNTPEYPQRIAQPPAHWLYHFHKVLPAGVRRAAFRKFYQRNTGALQAIEENGLYTTCYDASCSLSRLELLRTVVPNVKVIHVMRNPYEFVASNIGLRSRSHVRLLDEWLRYNEAAITYERILGPAHYLKVHYESFVHSPAESAEKLYSFLQLEPLVFSVSSSLCRKLLVAKRCTTQQDVLRIEAKPQTWKQVLSKQQIHDIDRSIFKYDWALAVP